MSYKVVSCQNLIEPDEIEYCEFHKCSKPSCNNKSGFVFARGACRCHKSYCLNWRELFHTS